MLLQFRARPPTCLPASDYLHLPLHLQPRTHPPSSTLTHPHPPPTLPPKPSPTHSSSHACTCPPPPPAQALHGQSPAAHPAQRPTWTESLAPSHAPHAIHSFIHSFIHSCIHAFIHSFRQGSRTYPTCHSGRQGNAVTHQARVSDTTLHLVVLHAIQPLDLLQGLHMQSSEWSGSCCTCTRACARPHIHHGNSCVV